MRALVRVLVAVGRQPEAAVLPFTAEQFFAVFAVYNLAIWPAQAVAYPLGAAALAIALRGGTAAGRVVPLALVAMWIWTGAAYHLPHFAPINPTARIYGAGFLVQGALFLGVAARGLRLAFGAPRTRSRLAFRPTPRGLHGRALSAIWPAVPSFGVTPCPVTIFSFGVLLLARGRVPAWLLAGPALWALVGGSAAVLLAVPQDWMLLAGGIAATAVFLRSGPRRREPDTPPRIA